MMGAAFRRSSIRVISLPIVTSARAEVGWRRVRVRRDVGIRAVRRREPLCARWNAGLCARGARPRGGRAHKALPVRSLPDLGCLLTGAGLCAREGGHCYGDVKWVRAGL
jgi:hypothetical protein